MKKKKICVEVIDQQIQSLVENNLTDSVPATSAGLENKTLKPRQGNSVY